MPSDVDAASLRDSGGAVDRDRLAPWALADSRHRWSGAAPALLCFAYAVLLLAWGVGNPPFTAPDEEAHYLRAIGVGAGQLIGAPFAYPVPEHQQKSFRWINQAARLVHVPPGLYAPGLGCNGGQPAMSAACIQLATPLPDATFQPTPVGNYQPLPYFLPGLAARFGDDPRAADRLGRLAAGVTCWVFLALAVALAWQQTMLSLAGPLLAVSPMTLFLAASLTPSGLEIAAGLAFAAALLRRWRATRADPIGWLALGVSGAILALSRSTGALWVALDVTIFIGLAGMRGLVLRGRRAPLAAACAVLLLVAGVSLSLLWERVYGSNPAYEPGSIASRIAPALTRLPGFLSETVGVFGALDTSLPRPIYVLWGLLSAVFVGVAFLVGTNRERLVLAAMAGGSVLVPIVFSALLTAGTGFDVQGRHVLPLLVMLPLLAGEIVARHATRLPMAAIGVGMAILIGMDAALQLLAWYWNARRQASGIGGPLWFVARAEWVPPLGWWPWMALALIGSGCLALLNAFLLFRHPRRPAT